MTFDDFDHKHKNTTQSVRSQIQQVSEHMNAARQQVEINKFARQQKVEEPCNKFQRAPDVLLQHNNTGETPKQWNLLTFYVQRLCISFPLWCPVSVAPWLKHDSTRNRGKFEWQTHRRAHDKHNCHDNPPQLVNHGTFTLAHTAPTCTLT